MIPESLRSLVVVDEDPAKVAESLRRRTGSLVVDGFFEGISRVSKLGASRAFDDVEVEKNIPYVDDGCTEHLLDIYRPRGRTQGLPVLLYVHGGGFRILSKDTHWIMGLAFARRGFLVFNINYRLAPEHKFPAALEDCSAAYTWVVENAHRWGGDLDVFVVAGESAGANLASSLTISACFERPESFAQSVYATGRVPDAVLAACGILQVSDVERFRRKKGKLPTWLTDRLEEVPQAYLPSPARPGEYGLADPLVLLESDMTERRELPPFFAPVGTRDPLLDDTRRLERALLNRGAVCEARYYPGEIHAFHAFLWRKYARLCWRDHFRFLDHQIPQLELLRPSS